MRDIPSTLKHATVWLLLVLGGVLAVKAWQAEQQAQRSAVSADGQTVTLRRAPDGHFHWPGEVNGQAVDFLIDTGATRTALPTALAEGLPREATVQSQTAGGLATGHVVRVALALDGGLRVDALPVTVLPGLQTPLLGMDVLSRLQFQQSGGELRLQLPGRNRAR